jgi:hypothetical protein
MLMKGTLQVSHKKKGLLGGGEILLGGGRPFPDWMRCNKNNLFCHMISSQPLSRILAKATFDGGGGRGGTQVSQVRTSPSNPHF